MFRIFFCSSGIAVISAINVEEKKAARRVPEAPRRTCEELQVGEGLRQHPPTLFLHRQGDDHETIC